jgi:hypothetical protein
VPAQCAAIISAITSTNLSSACIVSHMVAIARDERGSWYHVPDPAIS